VATYFLSPLCLAKFCGKTPNHPLPLSAATSSVRYGSNFIGIFEARIIASLTHPTAIRKSNSKTHPLPLSAANGYLKIK
jgi:hypothetical protein